MHNAIHVALRIFFFQQQFQFWGNIAENRLCNLQVYAIAIYQTVTLAFRSWDIYCLKSILLKLILSIQFGPLPHNIIC